MQPSHYFVAMGLLGTLLGGSLAYGTLYRREGLQHVGSDTILLCSGASIGILVFSDMANTIGVDWRLVGLLLAVASAWVICEWLLMNAGRYIRRNMTWRYKSTHRRPS